MSTNILSFELILFVGALFILLNIRKKKMFTVDVVNGLITYVPPLDEDFDMLEKTDQKVKTNMKGEAKKFDKSKVNKSARFPMRTLPIGKEFLEFNVEFFETYDFIMLMFIICIFMFVVTSTLRVFPNDTVSDLIKTNLTFYILLLLLMLVI